MKRTKILKILSTLSLRTPRFKGKTRILKFFQKFILPDKPIIANCNGVNFNLNLKEHIDFQIFYFGTNEPGILRYLIKNISNNKKVIFWDIGANVGSVSLPLLVEKKQLQVIGFEPSPKAIIRLQKNLKLNPNLAKRFNLKKIGLFNKNKSGLLYESKDEKNQGLSSLTPLTNVAQRTAEVKLIKGDYLIYKNKKIKPHFIKMMFRAKSIKCFLV